MTSRDPSNPAHAPPAPEASVRARDASDTDSRSQVHLATLDVTNSAARHVTDEFDLRVTRLQDAASGRWDAPNIADALGVPLAELATMLGVPVRTLQESPNGADLQEPLASFANIVAMVEDYMGGDADRVQTWLRQPQARLGHRSPLAVLRTLGGGAVVEQWIVGLWLGEGE